VTQLLSKSLAHCFPDPLAHHLFEAIACGFSHALPHGFVDALAYRLQQALAGVAERLAAKARVTRSSAYCRLNSLIETRIVIRTRSFHGRASVATRQSPCDVSMYSRGSLRASPTVDRTEISIVA
jgi:hypothetical protein